MVAATVAVASLGLEAIVGFPHRPDLVAVAATVLVPFALVGRHLSDATVRRIDRLLVRTIVVAGLIVLVEVTYLLVVIGLGHVPTSSDRQVLASSMIAAAVAALLAIPTRDRLTRWPTSGSTATAGRPTNPSGPSPVACRVPCRSTSCSCSWPSRCTRPWA